MKCTKEFSVDWLDSLTVKEFADLYCVQIDESPKGTGNAIFYNDGKISVSVDIGKKQFDDNSVWNQEFLLTELKLLAMDTLRGLEQ